MIATCKACNFRAEPKDFKACLTAYHDLRCPQCGSTNIDTSELNQQMENYGWGDNNSFRGDRPWLPTPPGK